MTDLDRAPGWYPDPEADDRFRHWDGVRWTRVTSSVPHWGATGGTPPRSRRIRRFAPVCLVVAVALAAAAVLLPREGPLADETTASGPGLDTEARHESQDNGADVTESVGGAHQTELGSDEGSSLAGPDGAVGRREAAGGGGPDAPDATRSEVPDVPTTNPGATNPPGGERPGLPVPPSSPPQVDPGCAITAAEVDKVLDVPEVRRVVGEAAFSTVRCSPGWAAAATSGGLVAVLRGAPGDWTLVALGDDQPCNELDMPSDVAVALGCGSAG